MNFDLSGADAGTIASGELKIRSSADSTMFLIRTAQTDEHMHVAKLEAGSSFTTTDWNDMTGWVSSGDQDGEVTEYATKISQQGSGGWNTWTLNSTAISDINSALTSGSIQMMILSSQDFNGGDFDDPYDGGFFGTHAMLFYTSEASSSLRPYIELTYAEAATDNAVFFGTNL